MNIKHFFFLVLLVFFAPELRAQVMPKSFNEDATKFIEEMRVFFDSYESKAGRDFIDEFNEKYWVPGRVTPAMKTAVINNANMMVKKKFRPSPEYFAYFNTIKAIVDKSISLPMFQEWQQCYTRVANGRNNKPFSDFILMSEGLYQDSRFYRSATSEWKTFGGTWVFECDSAAQIRFTNTTLVGYAKGDSTVITNTSGTYYVNAAKWVGRGGRVNWKRVELSETEVFANLNRYSINVKQVSYVADSVTFFNRAYFRDNPLQGKLTEKAIPEGTELKSSYPKFESYSSRYQIKAIYSNVDFEGGFTQLGARFIGSGTKSDPSYLYFKRNGKNFLIVSTTAFAFTKERVASTNASVKFILDNDSIYHPLVDFKFFVDTGRVLIYRSEEGGSRAPFYNSFHKVDMYIQLISWMTNSPQIQFGTLPGNTQAEAYFPSANYYRQYQYDRLLGMETLHPLIRIRNFVRDNGGKKQFTTTELANHWKTMPENLRPLMMQLSNDGFIYYDPQSDIIQYKEKSDVYIAARAGKTDYDNIEFRSNVASGDLNGKLNLLNYDLTLFGVKEVTLSDSQNVVVFPEKDMLVLKKNRNFAFEGSVMAGRFDYYGRLFAFDYEQFQINLNNVDSVRIYVDGKERDPRDPKGGYVQVRLKSVIENLNGTLKVDYSNNKSGLKSKEYARYPIFTSEKPSFIYYDKPGIQKGVYNRDKFYFKVDPFTIDSLDNFSGSGLRFGGVLQSSGIFPEIRDSARVMPDYSLGFTRQAPPGGYPLYGGKAKFNNTIRLSNQGLKGDGSIEYITSTSTSKDFTFFPDSTNGIAQSFVMEAQKLSGKTEYPTANGGNLTIHWMPKKDYMTITTRDSLLNVFDKKSRFKGTLTLSPKSLNGNGTLVFSNAEMDAKRMLFKHHIVDSDTADFRLNAFDASGLAFSTKNVNAHIDFEKREGDFKANGKGSVVNFPVNQYICFMDNFKWYMDKAEIELNAAEQNKQQAADKIDLEGPEFISIHPRQDSLRFRAPRAKYDLKNYIIYAKLVKEVLVADARVIPDSGNITIERNAYMRPLNNAKIEANAITKYHSLFNCKVEIFSRRSYKAEGDYAYIDELKKEQIIHFSPVAPDTSGQTSAEGEIPDSWKFMLSPNYDFKGKVLLAANNQFLVFDGSTSLTHDCAIGKRRLRFKGQINPLQIYIPVALEMVDENGDPATAGIISTLDSVHVYGAFLSPKKARTDINVATADGFLFFDKATREYRISNREKLVERSLPGNYISLNTKTCVVYGEGKMNLGADLGQVVVMPVGNATHNTVNQTTTFDLVMAIDFHFDDELYQKIVDDIANSPNLAPLPAVRPTFERALTEIVGKEKADKYITQLNLYGGTYKKFPDELTFSFFFTDLKMVWNQKSRAYISTGKLGLASIAKKQINKFVPGTVMLERKKSGDVLTIYLELDGGKWYTFSYSNGNMVTYSSNDAYNTLLKDMKDDKRKKDGEKGQRSYQFRLGSPNDRTLIVKKIKRAEEGAADETPEPQQPQQQTPQGGGQ